MSQSVFTDLEQSAQTTADRLQGIDETNPLQTADYTGPLTPLAQGGMVVGAGATVDLIPASGRVFLEVNHAGPDGDIWLGLDQDAQANVGVFLMARGDAYEQFFGGAVSAFNASGAPILLTWVEWAGPEDDA